MSALASVQAREMSELRGEDDMEQPPFPGCCSLREGATVESTGRNGIIATLDPGRNRIKNKAARSARGHAVPVDPVGPGNKDGEGDEPRDRHRVLARRRG